MAHIGCFVPATYAEIGMVDRIIARTNQDGELMESFAADLVSPQIRCNAVDYFGHGQNWWSPSALQFGELWPSCLHGL